MDDTSIRVENLSKLYRIGLKEEIHDTMVGALADFIKRPLRNLKRLYRLTKFSEFNQYEKDVIWALKNVSLQINRGDVVGIIGRNGAGKSTLLKILSKITYATEGRIEWTGRISSLLEVGTGFHPELTGRENNIYLNGTILGMRKKEIDNKFDDILDFSGVGKFIDTPVKRYSSGMRVRLAFSVAAHLEPEILLVDEVLAVGDIEFQNKCLGKMEDVSRSGRTILFVSHNMAAIQSLCTRVIVLTNGSITFDGTSVDAIQYYLNNECSGPFEGSIELASYRTINKAPFYLQELRVLNTDGQEQRIFEIGSSIIIEFELFSEGRFLSPHIGIAINSLIGVRMFTVSTRFSKFKYKEFSGEKRIRLVLQNVLLAPGQYNLKATLGDSITDFDIVDGVPAFEILGSDYWGTGKLPSASQGLMIQDVIWYDK